MYVTEYVYVCGSMCVCYLYKCVWMRVHYIYVSVHVCVSTRAHVWVCVCTFLCTTKYPHIYLKVLNFCWINEFYVYRTGLWASKFQQYLLVPLLRMTEESFSRVINSPSWPWKNQCMHHGQVVLLFLVSGLKAAGNHFKAALLFAIDCYF